MPARVDPTRLALLREAALAEPGDRAAAAAVFSDFEAEHGHDGAAWVRAEGGLDVLTLHGWPVLVKCGETGYASTPDGREDLDALVDGLWVGVPVYAGMSAYYSLKLVVPDAVQPTHVATRGGESLYVAVAESDALDEDTGLYDVVWVAYSHAAAMREAYPELRQQTRGDAWRDERDERDERWNLAPLKKRAFAADLKTWRTALALLRKALR